MKATFNRGLSLKEVDAIELLTSRIISAARVLNFALLSEDHTAGEDEAILCGVIDEWALQVKQIVNGARRSDDDKAGA